MKKYFKKETEFQCDKGFIYLEFEEEIPMRQVDVYGNKYFCSLDEYHTELGPGLCDQPLSQLGLSLPEESSAEEFEEAWEKAIIFRNQKKKP